MLELAEDDDKFADDASNYPEQYRTGPSFGERIGAKPTQAQPAPKAVQTPAPAPPPIQIDAANLPAGILPAPGANASPAPGQSATAAPSDMTVSPAAMPDMAAARSMRTRMLRIGPSEIPKPQMDPTRQSLIAKSAALGSPINPYVINPANGKMQTKPEYRMGWKGRLAGTAANFLNGFARDGAAPIYVGPGATNRRYAADEKQREGNLAATRTQLGDVEKTDEYKEQLYKDATNQAYRGELGEAALQRSQAQQDAALARQESAASQKELADYKTSQLVEPKTEPELAIAYQTAVLKNDAVGKAKYKGALDLLKQQKAAGKDTSAADLQKFLQVSEFRVRQHQAIDDEKEKERASLYADANKTGEQTFDVDGSKTAARKAEIDRQLEGKYKAQHDAIDAQADQMAGLTKTGSHLRQPSLPPSSAPAAHKPVTSMGKYKVGAIVNLKGKGAVKITKLYSDGKFEYEPAK